MKLISNNVAKVTNILNDLEYHDGDTIGKNLNITRAAIWKIINKLKNYGIKIQATKGKGYQLDKPLLLLDEEYLKNQLAHLNLNILLFETLDSTNNYLKLHSCQDINSICIAEYQEKGKGRFGRNWFSPFGQNLYLSYYYHFTKDLSEISGLSLVVSMAIFKSLNELCSTHKLQIKWPNDIIHNYTKLAGILIELVAESNSSGYAIIGIGINVNMDNDDDKQINQDWCSLASILNCYLDRNTLCVSIVKNLVLYLDKFNEHGFSSFMEEWKEADSLINKPITITLAGKKIKGIARGVDQFGKLLLEVDDIILSYNSGDITLDQTL